MKPTVNVAFSSERVWTFLTLVGQRKSHGKKGRRALWLHMKEKKYVAAIVKEIICHISPHFTAKKKKKKRRKDKRGPKQKEKRCWGLKRLGWSGLLSGLQRAVSSLSLWFSYRILPRETGWSAWPFKKKRKNCNCWMLTVFHSWGEEQDRDR